MNRPHPCPQFAYSLIRVNSKDGIADENMIVDEEDSQFTWVLYQTEILQQLNTQLGGGGGYFDFFIKSTCSEVLARCFLYGMIYAKWLRKAFFL